MEDKAGSLKCACADCGAVITYLPAQAGQLVKCPKCGEQSRLPPHNPLAAEDESDAPPRICPACGSRLGPRDFTCPECEERQRKQKALVKNLAIGIGAVAVLAMVAFLVGNRHKNSDYITLPAPTSLSPPPFKVRTPKSLNDLSIGRFTIERDKDNVGRIVGTVENTSDNLHLSITINLDLLDDQGRKVESVSDSITQLPGHSTWRVIVRTPNSIAQQVRVSGINEAP